MGRDDDALDLLNREVFAQARNVAGPVGRRELALHQMLMARSLERVGDNAVDIAEQAAFIVTGEYREFSDASRPKSLGLSLIAWPVGRTRARARPTTRRCCPA